MRFILGVARDIVTASYPLIISIRLDARWRRRSRRRRHRRPGPHPLVDPLILQRKRLKLFFDYDRIFEAYVPKAKRRFGYFALPVLLGDEIVAAIDLKTAREQQKLRVQQWTWIGKSSKRAHKKLIEEALHRFERFQLCRWAPRR